MDPLLLLLIGMIALLAFQFFYNSRRRKQQQEKRKEQLVPGANIMTNSGFFGTVVSVMETENKVVVELSPGVEVTLHTQAIANIEEQTNNGDPNIVAPEDGMPAATTVVADGGSFEQSATKGNEVQGSDNFENGTSAAKIQQPPEKKE